MAEMLRIQTDMAMALTIRYKLRGYRYGGKKEEADGSFY